MKTLKKLYQNTFKINKKKESLNKNLFKKITYFKTKHHIKNKQNIKHNAYKMLKKFA